MEQVSFAKDERFLQLDHVFVRGIIVQDAQILHESKGSDHYPLEVRLALD
jgi:endonuclease/exonuclease/phosphatase (EEP) superfamily protein YafD